MFKRISTVTEQNSGKTKSSAGATEEQMGNTQHDKVLNLCLIHISDTGRVQAKIFNYIIKYQDATLTELIKRKEKVLLFFYLFQSS